MNSNIDSIEKLLKPVDFWISEDDLVGIYSAEYWNDIEEEKKKEWWINDGDYHRCLSYLIKTGLMGQWESAANHINHKWDKAGLQVVDVAAGIGWTSALLSKLEKVKEVNSVEISRHRLITIFPYAIDMFSGIPGKINRYVGSFYDLKIDDSSMDLVFLSQAFHHADKPLKLLSEIDRVTKSGGKVIFIGENYITLKMRFKRFLKNVIQKKKLTINFYKLFPADNIGGDHYYRLNDYYVFFQSMGYDLEHKIFNKSGLVIFATKP